MKHKDLSTEVAAGTAITRKENRHYSFNHQHKHLWHCVWVWILIISFLTPQFTYDVEAGLGHWIEKNIIRPVVHAPEKIVEEVGRTAERVGKEIGRIGERVAKEVERGGHKVEKYMIRPLNDPKVIGKVAAMALVAYLCPPALGTLAGTGGILAAGAASATYDRVVLNVHNGGDLTKSFLTAAGSAAVTAAFNKYLPIEEDVIDPVTGKVTGKVVVLSTGEQYLRGVAISISHIAVNQVSELIVEGKGTLGGRAWSGALAGAFVPSVQLVTDNNLVATLMDPINRSVVEQSVVNRFNMNKVDFGAAVTSGAQALRDQYIKEKTVEFVKVVENWYESEQESSSTKREIASERGNKNKKSISDYVEEKAMTKNITGVVVDLKNFSQESFNEAVMEAYCKGVPVVIIDESDNRYVCVVSRPLNSKGLESLYNNPTSLFRHDLLMKFDEDGKVIESRGYMDDSKVKINEHLERDHNGREFHYEVRRSENGEPICYNAKYYDAVIEGKTVEWNSKKYMAGFIDCQDFGTDVVKSMDRVKTCSEWQVSKFLNPQNRSQK